MALLSANAAVVLVSALVFSNPPLASVPSMSPVVFVVGISFFINPFLLLVFSLFVTIYTLDSLLSSLSL
jgi:hypothetical protein